MTTDPKSNDVPSVSHTAVFPPASTCACRTENWLKTPITAHGDPILADKTACQSASREDEDPERWDGMS